MKDASRIAQHLLCKSIISQMLVNVGIHDAWQWIPILYPIEFEHRSCLPSIEDLTASVLHETLSKIQEELENLDLSKYPFEILSDIHESYLTRNPKSGKFEYSSEMKKKGIYYTPDHIVRYIAARTLEKHLWGTQGYPMKAPEEICNLRILDPACGSGSFLTCAFDILAEFYAFYEPDDAVNWVSKILQEHLYGIDMDNDAVGITIAILKLKALKRIGYMPSRIPELKISQGNFLISSLSADGKLAASEVLNEGGFSMILGNPPYGAKISKAERELIRADYETCESSDSSSLFIEKAVKMLRDGGILGFVVPKSLSYVVSWQPIRKFLLSECRILEIADARKAFRGVRLEQIVLIAQKNGRPNTETIITILHSESVTLQYPSVSHTIDNSALGIERFSIWLSNRRIRDIVNRIWSLSVPLALVADIWSGLNIQHLPIFSPDQDSEHSIPCLRGKDIQRYHIRRGIQYIKMTDAVKHQTLSLEAFRRPKIVAQDIVAHIKKPGPHIKLMAAIDRTEHWLNVNTVTNIAPRASDHLEYLCGILNSRLISWYAYNFIFNRAIRTMHFRPGYADHIPIRRVEPENPHFRLIYDQLMDYVSQIMALYEKVPVDADEVSELDSKIEKLVYQLYDISEDDIIALKEHAGLL